MRVLTRQSAVFLLDSPSYNSYSRADRMALIPFRASACKYSPKSLCSASLKPGIELTFSSRYFWIIPPSVLAACTFSSLLTAAVYSFSGRESLVMDGSGDVSIDGMNVSPIASNVIH